MFKTKRFYSLIKIFLSNRKKNDLLWNHLLKDEENENYLLMVNEFYRFDHLNPYTCADNFVVISSDPLDILMFEDRFNALGSSPTMNFYKERFNRAIAFPKWFTAGYPDVNKWFSENIDSVFDKPPFKGHINEKDEFNEDGELKPHILRMLIEFYKSNVNSKLEATFDYAVE